MGPATDQRPGISVRSVVGAVQYTGVMATVIICDGT